MYSKDLTFLFKDLENRAAQSFHTFLHLMNDVRKTFPLPENERWEWDDEKLVFRRVKLPDMEWLPYEEANDVP